MVTKVLITSSAILREGCSFFISEIAFIFFKVPSSSLILEEILLDIKLSVESSRERSSSLHFTFNIATLVSKSGGVISTGSPDLNLDTSLSSRSLS